MRGDGRIDMRLGRFFARNPELTGILVNVRLIEGG
jgi:hypothetical protein